MQENIMKKIVFIDTPDVGDDQPNDPRIRQENDDDESGYGIEEYVDDNPDNEPPQGI